ncbi:50S ribosomal protein L25/general stress protein Ctc [Nocardioidaceae bacterium]|nr:50S ribosomal protein L25/general stress protein Ctc [Nocardioidaceae bacterium]
MASKYDTVKAEARTAFGKGAARRIRREDKVPAVLYAPGGDVEHITLPGHDTMMALKHGGVNAIVEIDLAGDKRLALTKQVQSDPIKGFLEHVDFVLVKKGEKVTVEVPVNVIGEPADDALVTFELNTVTVEADPLSIPETADVDVTGLEAGTQFTAGQLELREGAMVLNDDDELVINVVHAPTAAEVEAELEAAEEEAGIEREESEDEAGEPAAESGDSEGDASGSDED